MRKVTIAVTWFFLCSVGRMSVSSESESSEPAESRGLSLGAGRKPKVESPNKSTCHPGEKTPGRFLALRKPVRSKKNNKRLPFPGARRCRHSPRPQISAAGYPLAAESNWVVEASLPGAPVERFEKVGTNFFAVVYFRRTRPTKKGFQDTGTPRL